MILHLAKKLIIKTGFYRHQNSLTSSSLVLQNVRLFARVCSSFDRERNKDLMRFCAHNDFQLFLSFSFELLGKFLRSLNCIWEIVEKILTLWAVEAFQFNCIIPAFHRVHSAHNRSSVPNLFLVVEDFLRWSIREFVVDNGRLVGRWFRHFNIHWMHFILSTNTNHLPNPPPRPFRQSFQPNCDFCSLSSFSTARNQLINHSQALSALLMSELSVQFNLFLIYEISPSWFFECNSSAKLAIRWIETVSKILFSFSVQSITIWLEVEALSCF